MATHTVKQSGGDFSTLASACADSGTGTGDTISIEGTWTVDDTAAVTVSDNDITIQVDSDSKHPGYVDTSQNHHRLVVSGDHAITVNNDGLIIDGMVLNQDGSGPSDECIRYANAGTLTVKNTIFWASSIVSDQDGIYPISSSAIVDLENCSFYGFHRAGARTTTSNQTINVNSCTFWSGGSDSSSTDSAALAATDSGCTMNVFNTVVMDWHTQSNATDYSGSGDIHNSVDSDGSITDVDTGAVACLQNRSPTDSSSPGAGDWVMFEDITTSPYDLRLQDDTTNNDAQEMHTTSSGAGMSMPATDIVGNTRSSPYCCGAFHVVSGGPAFRPKHSPLHGPFSGPFGGPL